MRRPPNADSNLNIMRLSLLLLTLCSPFGSAADFPPLTNSETDLAVPLMPAAAAVKAMKVQEGFAVTLFAAEPEVQNPVAMNWDARGRLWIAENFTYAERAHRFDLSLRDRVLIFEDRDGDGKADSRKVFTDDVQMLTGLCIGRGGVWLMCPPQLLFIPDANGDDQPDGPPQVRLDGFTVARENYHNFANGLKWGPDGWLYGRVGHSCPGRVGKPGTPDKERAPVEGAMWRYHPGREVFEALNSGTTNPWGHDCDKHGELFFINTVVGHLWHSIPGAHYVSPFSLSPNPHLYTHIDQHADHYHFDTGAGWMASRDGKSNDLGGGHAHIGMMIYHGDNWPAAYRDKLFTVNMHGRRINTERLERHGSGYVGKHEPDFMTAADPWFRGLDLSTGPDGGVFLIDWSDTGECHENTGVHRQSGRIFKITHRDGAAFDPKQANLTAIEPVALAKRHRHANEWQVRTARQLLHEKALAGRDLAAAVAVLREQMNEKDAAMRLRALWTLRLIGGCDDATLRSLLQDPDEHLRTWAIRLLTDEWPLDLRDATRPQRAELKADPALLAEFHRLAAEDPSGLVRLALASALQRLPLQDRKELVLRLASRPEDAADHNLPAMLWFALIPVANADAQSLLSIAEATTWPDLRRFIARRLAEDLTKNPAPLKTLLTFATQKPGRAKDTLQGISEALAGLRKAPKPKTWDTFTAAATDPSLATLVRELSALFGDGRALDEMKKIALDNKAELTAREAALSTLIESRPDDLRTICEQLIEVRHLNARAARGLALFDDPAIGVKLAANYKRFSIEARKAVIDTLVSRPAFAKALLDRVDPTKIPRSDITAFHARQIRAFNDEKLNAKLTEVWGELRDTGGDKSKLIAEWKAKLAPDTLAKADLGKGRALYSLCAACHKLYGEGGAIGPDLTGSGRANLDYLLENILDPSGVVSPDYRMSLVTMKDGRILTGVVSSQNERTVTLRTLTDTQTLDRAEIDKQEISPVSMMPEGLLQALTEEQVRDLIAYLMHPVQVPVPSAK
jgi:putative membrane-bound dehydrogenase-like protein